MVALLLSCFDQWTPSSPGELPAELDPQYHNERQYTLTVSATTLLGGFGSVSPSPGTHTYNVGTSVTLTASPLFGSTITWEGACSGASTTCTVKMDGNKTVSVTFGPSGGFRDEEDEAPEGDEPQEGKPEGDEPPEGTAPIAHGSSIAPSGTAARSPSSWRAPGPLMQVAAACTRSAAERKARDSGAADAGMWMPQETVTYFGAPSESTTSELCAPDVHRLTMPWGSRLEASRLRARSRMEKARSRPRSSPPDPVPSSWRRRAWATKPASCRRWSSPALRKAGAADDGVDGDVAGGSAVLPGVVAAGDGVADAEAAVEAGDGFLLSFIEEEEGVAAAGRDGGVDVGEEAAEAALPGAPVFRRGQADVDDLDASAVRGILDEAQAAAKNLRPHLKGRADASHTAVAG